MKIQGIEFRNFRSFISFDLDLAGHSAWLIGENASGKTSLLTGIARALGRDLSFSSADFADLQQPIELRVTVTDLDAAQRAVFGNYAQFGAGRPTLELQARAIWDPVAEEAEVEHGYPRQAQSRSRREERDAIPLQWLPSGRDAQRMLQFGISRNLMGKVVEGLPIQPALETAVGEIRDASGKLGKNPALEQFLTAARNSLAELLPDVAPRAYSMGVSAVTLRDLLRQFELDVQHLGEPVVVASQSSGVAQLSVFVFAMKLAAHDSGTILLVDEPEISLHPQSQRALMRALRKLDSQILVATHSANLLDRADPRTIVRLRRSAAGIEIASPSGLSEDEARKLSRFTNSQTAEAFFARTVVLVEGMSDQIALEALAERRGRNLDAEGVAIVPIGGAKSIGSFLDLFGPQGIDVRLAGLCDAAEEGDFRCGLERAGLGSKLTRADMEAHGFYVCAADLEDELIRSLGAASVEQIIKAQGELGSFHTFQNQPAWRGRVHEEQLRRFFGTHSGRKIQYASLLVDALELARVPRPLDGVLTSV
jgi:predicted ATPase